MRSPPAGQHRDGRVVLPITRKTSIQENTIAGGNAQSDSMTSTAQHSANKKKARVSALPAANRYEVLADETIDNVTNEEMDKATKDCLADVEERLDNLKIRNTHVELDSIKKNGASGQE